MYGFFAKMTPINRHGLLSLALSVFDGPQEKTGGTLYLQAKGVLRLEHKLLSKQNDFALKSNYRVSKGWHSSIAFFEYSPPNSKYTDLNLWRLSICKYYTPYLPENKIREKANYGAKYLIGKVFLS